MTLATTSSDAEQVVGKTSIYVFVAFFLCLFIPGFLQLGVRIPPYRLFLILMIVPIARRLLEDRSLKITPVDVLFLAFLSWRVLAIIVNHFPAQAVFTVSLSLDFSLSYLFARTFIRTKEDFANLFKALLLVLVAFSPFILIEALTHQRVVRNIARLFLTIPGNDGLWYRRFGLLRVQLGFNHPVVFGFVCMVAFTNVVFIFWRDKVKSILAGLFVAVATLFAISSSSVIGLVLQASMMTTHVLLRASSISWGTLIAVGAFLFLLISILSGFQYGAVVDYVISNLVFSTWSGFHRSLQIEFGLMEAYRNPIFGIGQNPWSSPYWLSQSLDSHWLGVAMSSGFPAAALLAGAFIAQFVLVSTHRSPCDDTYNLKIGYLITLASTFIALFSVSLWSASEVYFNVFFAAGAWFYNPLSDWRPLGRRPPPERKRMRAQRRVHHGNIAEEAAGRRAPEGPVPGTRRGAPRAGPGGAPPRRRMRTLGRQGRPGR